MTERQLVGGSGELRGQTVRVPGSKSLTNRALIAAAVAGGGRIRYPLDCEDTQLLAKALAAAGWRVAWTDEITIGSRHPKDERVAVFLGNSGTGARFITALLAAVPGSFEVDGTPRLRERPMGPLVAGLQQLGADLETRDGFLPVVINGRQLEGGKLRLNPGVSSQFISALLLAAPLLRQGLHLTVEGQLPSRPYLDLTNEVLQAFGGEIECRHQGRGWYVGPRKLEQCCYEVEGDWSAAASFFAAAAVLGGTLRISRLRLDSFQGDRVLCEILQQAGMEIQPLADGVAVTGPVSRGLQANLRNAPDLFPALAAVAACTRAASRLEGLENLQYKESDRLSVMVDNLRRLGAQIKVDGSSFEVHRPVEPGTGAGRMVTAAEDHRIAMAMAVTALRTAPLLLDDADCVAKSFPGFWSMWELVLQ